MANAAATPIEVKEKLAITLDPYAQEALYHLVLVEFKKIPSCNHFHYSRFCSTRIFFCGETFYKQTVVKPKPCFVNSSELKFFFFCY